MLIPNTFIKLKLSHHATVSLAWRYGMILEKNEIEFFNKNSFRNQTDQDGITANGQIEDQKVRLVIDNGKIITALPLPNDKIFNNKESNICRDYFEALYSMRAITLTEIIDLRNYYMNHEEPRTALIIKRKLSQMGEKRATEDFMINRKLKIVEGDAESNDRKFPWINGDQLYNLGIDESKWESIFKANCLENIPGDLLQDSERNKIENFLLNDNKIDLEKLYNHSSDNLSGEPLKDFLVELDINQKKVLEKIKKHGPYLLKGGAGTGKSLVGIYFIKEKVENASAIDMFDEYGPRYGFLTYTNTLADANKALWDEIMPSNLVESNDDKTDFYTIDKLAWKIASDYKDKRFSSFKGWEIANSIKEIMSGQDTKELIILRKYSIEYIAEEITGVIYGNNLETLEAYINIKRRGRKRPLNLNARAAIWNLFEKFDAHCNKINKYTFEKVRIFALKQLEKNNKYNKYSALFVDEAQDFSKVMRLICLALIKDTGTLLLAADTAQSIHIVPPTWIETSKYFDFRKNKPLQLIKSYRSTKEILKAINHLRFNLDDDEVDSPLLTESTRSGPKPQLHNTKNTQLHEIIISHQEKNKNLNLGQIAILTANNKLSEKYHNYLSKHKIKNRVVKKGSSIKLNEQEVHIVTTYSSKGLGFPITIVPDLDDQHYPSILKINGCKDEQEKEKIMEEEQRLLYVALSRAHTYLHVIINPAKMSPFLNKFNIEDWEYHPDVLD